MLRIPKNARLRLSTGNQCLAPFQELNVNPSFSYFRIVLLCGCFLFSSLTYGQGVDIEPNNTCPIAQDIGTPILPFTLPGELLGFGEVADIDFFRLNGAPGDLLRVDLQGASSGYGTLPDPLLGLFDEECNLVDFNDDSGSVNSRILFTVPPSGTYVIAATAYPDFSFIGTGEGSYLLTVDQARVIDSISGRLVNVNDGNPVPGDFPNFSSMQLLACEGDNCFGIIGFQNADSDGNFRFEVDNLGNPILTGTYRLMAFANGFEQFFSDTFEVTENEALDLGDLAMTPLSVLGTVSGRLVDALDETPLSGVSPPFGVALLERCEDWGCYGVLYTTPDEYGQFQIQGIEYSLTPGMYRITASAEGYQQAVTAQFWLAEFEDFSFGDVALNPLPIQFGDVIPCEVPPGGGPCKYSVELLNRGPERFKGQAWSTVEYFPNETPYQPTHFQTGKEGTTNPMPVRLNLRAGQSVLLEFRFDVPPTIPELSTLCATVTVGSNPSPQFQNLGERYLFCALAQPGGFELLSDKEGHKRLWELKQQPKK